MNELGLSERRREFTKDRVSRPDSGMKQCRSYLDLTSGYTLLKHLGMDLPACIMSIICGVRSWSKLEVGI